MDLIKLLRSLEEFVFEAIALLFFYPVTLWRIVVRPLETMEYAEREEKAPPETRYGDAVSPPLMLLLTLALTNAVGVAMHITPAPGDVGPVAREIFASPQNLLMFRSVVFSLIPLMAALALLRREGRPASRDALRAPFIAQCYAVSPFALVVSASILLLQRPGAPWHAAGAAACGVACAWLVGVLAHWFGRKLQRPWMDCLGTASGVLLRAAVVLFFAFVPVVIL